MQKLIGLTLFLAILQICFAPPVTQNKKESGAHEEDSDISGLEDYMEYHRYLKEVVNALESDPEFRQKLEKADEHEIKSGKIAEELEFVSHHVRTRLDEIKRIELERLKELAEQKKKLEDPNSIDEDPAHHLDHNNPHTFEIEDLKKLIAKTTADLAEVDKKRKEQFKQYELEKEFKKQDKLNHTNGDEREKLEKEYKELDEKHKKHEKLHQPGHKAQLEEVWEEQDQMQQDFDPKTFFMLHDLDGNGMWDQEEVKSLFIKELDKMYQQGAPEDDMRERFEEMERMRESVFKEMDTNHDGFIDYNEFWAQTHSKDFNQDNGWQSIDEQKPYTDEELAEYIRQHEAANQIYQGHPGAYQVPPGGYQQIPPAGYQQVPPGGYQQVPPGGYQQVPPGGYQQQVPPGAYQQPPPGGYHQVPQGYQPPPPGGYQPVPPGSRQQIPPNQQAQGGYQQVPSGGYHPNAIPPQGQAPNGNVPQNAPHPAQLAQHDLNTNEIHPQQAGQVNHQTQQVNQPPSGVQPNNQNQQVNQPPPGVQTNNQNQQVNQPPPAVQTNSQNQPSYQQAPNQQSNVQPVQNQQAQVPQQAQNYQQPQQNNQQPPQVNEQGQVNQGQFNPQGQINQQQVNQQQHQAPPNAV